MPGAIPRLIRDVDRAFAGESSPQFANAVSAADPAPPEDTVFPQEIYCTAERRYDNVGQLGHYPFVQENLNNVQDGRRVAIYRLAEIKQLRHRSELI